MNIRDLRVWLVSEAEEEYQKFSSSLLPRIDNVLGVRLPKLRKKAKEIVKSDFKFLFDAGECLYFEEKLIKAFVIGLMDCPLAVRFEYVKDFVSCIDNWSVCDSFCASLKFTNSYKLDVWEFLQQYLSSSSEYELRFGVVMILNYFVTDEWIDKVLEVLFSLDSDKYYAQMGIAWAISVCLVKYFDKTLYCLKSSSFSVVIFKKTIQKGCESNRLTTSQKKILKNLLNNVVN